MFLLTPQLNKDEIVQLKKLFTWLRRFDKTPLDSLSNTIKLKIIANRILVNNIAEACLERQFGLKRYAVIRNTIWNKYTHEMVIDEISIAESNYYKFTFDLSGWLLRKDGSIGSKKDFIQLHVGYIARRMLDDTWHSIIPLNPIWIER